MWWSLRIWYCVLFVIHHGVSSQSFVWPGWVCALAFDDDWRGNIKWRLLRMHEKPWCLFPRVPWKKMGLAGQISCVPGKYVEPVKILVVCQSPSPSPPLLHHYRIRRAGRSRFDRCHTEFEWHCVLQSHAKHCTLMYCSVAHSFCDIVFCSATQSPCDIVQSMLCSATHSFCCNLHCSVTQISYRSYRWHCTFECNSCDSVDLSGCCHADLLWRCDVTAFRHNRFVLSENTCGWKILIYLAENWLFITNAE